MRKFDEKLFSEELEKVKAEKNSKIEEKERTLKYHITEAEMICQTKGYSDFVKESLIKALEEEADSNYNIKPLEDKIELYNLLKDNFIDKYEDLSKFIYEEDETLQE